MWYQNWAYPIFNQKGKLTNVIIQHTDITERKKMEEALLESQQHYNHMAAILPVMLYYYILNPDGSNQFLYLAPSCHDLLELNKKDLLADVSLFWNIVHKDDLQRLHQKDAITNQEG